MLANMPAWKHIVKQIWKTEKGNVVVSNKRNWLHRSYSIPLSVCACVFPDEGSHLNTLPGQVQICFVLQHLSMSNKYETEKKNNTQK